MTWRGKVFAFTADLGSPDAEHSGGCRTSFAVGAIDESAQPEGGDHFASKSEMDKLLGVAGAGRGESE
ncbi:hypothetical protein GCM10027068_11750 [Prescottella soli]